MKIQTQQNQMVRRPFFFAALLAGLFLLPAAPAQPAAPNVDNRFLLVFDTSSDMKPRLAATQKALDGILTTNANGQLHSGDSLGVWTFDQVLRAGQFPLQRWRPDNAATITATISAFAGSQRYAKKTVFEALMPVLNQLVQNSGRLTAVIFCDGYGEIHGTPYDTGINQVFEQRQRERRKARLPIVIVLRSQRGQYTGCMVSFPPQPVSFPEFPPWPEPAPAPTNAPAPVLPRANVPPLIIIGTTVTNHVPPPAPAPPPAPKPVPANPPPTAVTSTPAPVVASAAKAPDEVLLMETGTVPAQAQTAAAPLTTTNALAHPAANSPPAGHKGALAVGVVFLVAAIGLAVFLFRHAPKTGGDNPGGGSPKKD
jgi:hypothetical protein